VAEFTAEIGDRNIIIREPLLTEGDKAVKEFPVCLPQNPDGLPVYLRIAVLILIKGFYLLGDYQGGIHIFAHVLCRGYDLAKKDFFFLHRGAGTDSNMHFADGGIEFRGGVFEVRTDL